MNSSRPGSFCASARCSAVSCRMASMASIRLARLLVGLLALARILRRDGRPLAARRAGRGAAGAAAWPRAVVSATLARRRLWRSARRCRRAARVCATRRQAASAKSAATASTAIGQRAPAAMETSNFGAHESRRIPAIRWFVPSAVDGRGGARDEVQQAPVDLARVRQHDHVGERLGLAKAAAGRAFFHDVVERLARRAPGAGAAPWRRCRARRTRRGRRWR